MNEAVLANFLPQARLIAKNIMLKGLDGLNEEQLFAAIHEAILSHFEAMIKLGKQYQDFTEDKKLAFAKIMYDMLKPIADQQAN
jgi:hypothetical protein